MQDVLVHSKARPQFEILIPKVIIIAEAVSFFDFLVAVIYVVHCLSRRLSIVTHQICVGIVEILTSQKVFHRLVVRTAIAE